MSSTIGLMYEALKKFQDATDSPTMPSQQIAAFLYVAERGEVPQADLEDATGVSQSSVSRNVSLLAGGLPSEKREGYGLLETYDDPLYRRRKLVRLTEKGRALRWMLEEEIAKGSGEPPAKKGSSAAARFANGE